MTRPFAFLGGALVAFALGVAVALALMPRPAPPLDPLPPETVVVETVREIPGPVVERVQWRTREVPVPHEVWREVCPGPVTPPEAPRADLVPPEEIEVVPRGTPLARVSIRAEKWEGTLPSGRPGYGWLGDAACELSPEDGRWIELARSPLDLRESAATLEATSRAARLPPRRDLRAGLTSAPGVRLGASWWRSGRRLGAWAEYDYPLGAEADHVVAAGLALRF